MDNRLYSCTNLFCLSDGGTQEAKKCTRLEMGVQTTSLDRSQMLLSLRTSCDGERNLVVKFLTSHCREKLLVRNKLPVPQTDTGRRGENPKARGRTLVKELGKMTP